MNTLKNKTQKEAYKLVGKQLIGVLILSVFAFILTSFRDAYSVLAGGFAYIVPNLVLVWRVFRFAGANQMTQFVSAFFVFEMLKLILSAIFFLIIVKYLPVSLLSVLAGFVGAIVSFWVASICQFSKSSKCAAKPIA